MAPMFCPKCGKADQLPETYCRQCGAFLPDFDKIENKETPVEQHLLVNSIFSGLTAFVSLTLAVTLYFMLIGREGTPWILYVVFGFLISITVWQIQTIIRTRILRKHFEKMKLNRNEGTDASESVKPPNTSRLLDDIYLENAVPASVTDRTTRDLVPRSPQPKQ